MTLLRMEREQGREMNGTQHIVIGAGTVLATNYFVHAFPFEPLPVAIATGAAIVGALLPDVDQNNSTIRQKTGTARGQGPLGCLGWIGGIVAAALGGHRGFTHTLVAVAVLTFALWKIVPGFQFYDFAFWTGYVSHIIADMLTEGGVPLLWPLTSRRIGLWR